MKIKELSKIAMLHYKTNQTYCERIIKEYEDYSNHKIPLLDLSKSNLYNEVLGCNSQLEAIEKYIEYFNCLYLVTKKAILEEDYKSCALIRDTIKIDKKICQDNIKGIDDEFLEVVELAEKEVKKLYKI